MHHRGCVDRGSDNWFCTDDCAHDADAEVADLRHRLVVAEAALGPAVRGECERCARIVREVPVDVLLECALGTWGDVERAEAIRSALLDAIRSGAAERGPAGGEGGSGGPMDR